MKQRRDSKPRPLEQQSPPITTRPGLAPSANSFVLEPVRFHFNLMGCNKSGKKRLPNKCKIQVAGIWPM